MFAFPAMMKGSIYVPPPTPVYGNLWFTNSDSALVNVDQSGTILNSYFNGYSYGVGKLEFDGTQIWASVNNSGTNGLIWRYNSLGLQPTIGPLPFFPGQMAFDGIDMWTVNSDETITKFDPTGSYTIRTTLSGKGPAYIAFDGTNMWTSNTDNSVTKIPPSGSPVSYSISNYGPIAFDGTSMWVISAGGISKISSLGTVTPYTGTGYQPNSIAFDGTNMWVSSTYYVGNPVFQYYDYIYKISPAGTITTYASTVTIPTGIVFDGTHIFYVGNINWGYGAPGQNVLAKIDLNGNFIEYSDPAGAYNFYGTAAFDGCLLSHWWGGS